jgi:hypothetical protein
MGNCMIQSKGLSLHYWEKISNCENYIVNHTPTKALKNITLEEAWNKVMPYVNHFYVFGSVAWAHILDEKRKSLQPKIQKCIFVGYSEYVIGYRLLQPHSNDIIRRYVNFDENILACKPNSTFVPSSTCDPYLAFVSSSIPILVSFYLDDDSEDENPSTPAHLPPDESIQHEPTLVPPLLRWVIQHKKQLVILSLILHINVRHIHSSIKSLLFWIKFQRLVIQTHLEKFQVI